MFFANQLAPVQSSSNHWTEPPKCQCQNPANVSKLLRRCHIHQLLFQLIFAQNNYTTCEIQHDRQQHGWSPCWHGLVASLARNPARLERESFNFCGPSWLELWSHTCLEQHWKLGHYAVNLPCDRWLPRLLQWKPIGQRRVGPRQQWDDMLRMFCRYKRLGEWELAARDGCNWETLMPELIIFCNGS